MKWWNHRREYPVLSQLALDYLSIPLLLSNGFSLRVAASWTSLAIVCPLLPFVVRCVWDLGVVTI
ncbi:hypothetical protein R3P38DRAFT_3103583 [Favolaschia claudopus]|uniref:Uncharacterized protein n=1 Tax=Favolaschia claudopus TaxID=2862362 RepID=A0AAV9ZKE0_9AGAR